MESQTQTEMTRTEAPPRRRRAAPEDPATVDLWNRYRLTRDLETRNALVENYVPLVRGEARRLSAALSHTVNPQELESAGTVGLIDCIDHFDPAQGFRFVTFCTPRIRGAMFDELRSWDWTPRVTRAKLNRLERACKALEDRLGRAPEDQEVAGEMGLSGDELRELHRSRNRALVSLDRSWADGLDPRDETPAATLEDHGDCDPVRNLEKRELIDLIRRMLTATERRVVTLYYYEHINQKQIGRVFGVTESRICQILGDVVLKLRKRFG